MKYSPIHPPSLFSSISSSNECIFAVRNKDTSSFTVFLYWYHTFQGHLANMPMYTLQSQLQNNIAINRFLWVSSPKYKNKFRSQWVVSVSKGPRGQDWCPALDPENPHGGRRQPQTVLWFHTYEMMCIHPHIHNKYMDFWKVISGHLSKERFYRTVKMVLWTKCLVWKVKNLSMNMNAREPNKAGGSSTCLWFLCS